MRITENKVNVHGSAIALDHPLGITGGRLVVSLLIELKIYIKLVESHALDFKQVGRLEMIWPGNLESKHHVFNSNLNKKF